MLTLSILLFALPVAFSGICESPKYSSSGFSTLDGFFHYSSTYIVEFSLQCANNVRDVNFFAVINGKSYHVAASEETLKYQVSWQLEHANSGQQTFDIKIYDEDKFAEYKKVQQSSGNVDNVQPLFNLSHYHAGISRKAPVSAESVFLFLMIAVVYYAVSVKNQFKN